MRCPGFVEIDLVGQGPRAASYLGLNTSRVILVVSALSGGLAGLAGAGIAAVLLAALAAAPLAPLVAFEK